MLSDARRSRLAAVSVCAALAGLVAGAGTAQAFALKRTSLGLPCVAGRRGSHDVYRIV
jgi:hypothetical protein